MLRLYKSTTTVGQRYQYDGTDLIGLYSDAGALTKRFVFGAGTDEPIVVYAGSGTGTGVRAFFHADERGSIVAQSDENGVKTGIFSYDEYGIPSSANNTRFQYTGQAWLPQLGMYYYKARMYSPTLGRFMQTDPIGYGDGMGIYAYVKNDPINFKDPNGLKERTMQLGGATYTWTCMGIGDDVPCKWSWTSFDERGLAAMLLGPSWSGIIDFAQVNGGLGGAAEPSKPNGCPSTPNQWVHSAGIQMGGNASLGAGHLAGATADWSMGEMIFPTRSAMNSYSTVGATAYAGHHDVAGTPNQQQAPTVIGASLGVGPAVVFSNATDIKQLDGPFSTTILNTPLLSFSFSEGGGIWSLAVGGPSLGLSESRFTTETIANGGC